ncbi:MAG: sulfatase/phosphatase domain-containing protein, partial [Ginsengibacter sp.]
KGILLEGGIHVPFVMNWPGTISAGTVFHDPVSSLDIAPTFIANAGGLTDKLEGVNLVSNTKQTKTNLAERQLKWRFTISAAIREGKWKLVRLPDRLPMLYNLEKDSSELHDVSLKNLDKTKTLLKKLGDWDVSLPHPVFLEGAVWKKRQLHLYDVPYPLVQPR